MQRSGAAGYDVRTRPIELTDISTGLHGTVLCALVGDDNKGFDQHFGKTALS